MSKQGGAAPRGLARTARGWAFAAAALVLPLAAHAQNDDPVKALAAPPPIQLPLKPSPEFARFPRYVGTLGKRPIVMRLGPKTDDDDPGGVHGEYQYTDTGEVILIAGDREGGTLEAEESNDGTHITGNWVGTFAGDGTLSGERMEVDDSNPVPFELKPLATGQTLPGAPAAPAVGASSTPGGQPVGGVGNLRTGE